MADRKKKAKSPYQKYGKTEYRYSELYRQWRAAVIAGRRDEAARLGRDHDKRFVYDACASDAFSIAA